MMARLVLCWLLAIASLPISTSARRKGSGRGASSTVGSVEQNAGCEAEAGFDAAMAKAVRLVRSQDHLGALPCLEVAHAERGDNIMAALYLGEALLRTGSLLRGGSVLEVC